MGDRPHVEYAGLLRSVDLFAGLNRVSLSKLAAHLEPMPMRPGATLIFQGDPPGDVFLVSRGSFGVFVATPEGGERRVATCARGEPIGEMALLTDMPRSATVRADTEAEVLRFERGRFLGLVRRDPSVAAAIARTLSHRLQVADTSVVERSDPVAEDRPSSQSLVTPVVDTAADVVRRPLWRPDRAAVGFLLAGLALLIGWAVPPPAGLSVPGWHALVTLVALVALLVSESLPDGALSLALIGVWVLGLYFAHGRQSWRCGRTGSIIPRF